MTRHLSVYPRCEALLSGHCYVKGKQHVRGYIGRETVGIVIESAVPAHGPCPAQTREMSLESEDLIRDGVVPPHFSGCLSKPCCFSCVANPPASAANMALTCQEVDCASHESCSQIALCIGRRPVRSRSGDPSRSAVSTLGGSWRTLMPLPTQCPAPNAMETCGFRQYPRLCFQDVPLGLSNREGKCRCGSAGA